MKRTGRRGLARSLYWILHPDHSVEPENDLHAWGRWMARCERRVALNWWVIDIDGVRAGIRVSTVFLGVDHNWGSRGPAILFESMIFGGPHMGDQRRYVTWEGAMRGHGKLVARERRWLANVGDRDATFWEAGIRGRGRDPGAATEFAGPSLAKVVAEGEGWESDPADAGDGG